MPRPMPVIRMLIAGRLDEPLGQTIAVVHKGQPVLIRRHRRACRQDLPASRVSPLGWPARRMSPTLEASPGTSEDGGPPFLAT